MQTDYRFNWIRGIERFKRTCYRYEMITEIANQRYKILQFYEKYGLEATIEAFDISKRTLFRWKSILKKNNYDISYLNPKSTKPKKVRKTAIPQKIIDEIKQLREDYPNMGKAKLYHILKPWCEGHNLPVISESSIGRIISNDKNKMRFAPLRIDHYGRTKPKNLIQLECLKHSLME